MTPAERKREWKLANPEKWRAQKRRYKKRHPEKIAPQKARYRKRHADELAARTRDRYARDAELREKAKNAAMRWHRENPERHRTYQRNYSKVERANLRPNYVKSLLCKGAGLHANEVPPSLVELKRAQLQIVRKLKEINK